MPNEPSSYQQLTPECQLDALASIGLYPLTGLVPLNSYENRVYAFTDENQQRYVVKFYRPQRWSKAQILEEHQFALHLQQDAVNLSCPVNIDGKTLHQFAGYFFALFTSLSARSLELDNIDNLYEVGVALGQLHKSAANYQFSERSTLDIQATIEKDKQQLQNCTYIPEPLYQPFFNCIEKIQEKIARQDFSYTNIALHGDAHASNILLKEETPYWVDFDDCKMGPAVQDIWMLLSGERNDQQLQLSMLLEGYQEVIDFDTKQLQHIEALRTMRIINYVNWIHQRWSDPAFYRNFTWFTTDQYWKELLQSLQQQLILLDEAPLSLQPQF